MHRLATCLASVLLAVGAPPGSAQGIDPRLSVSHVSGIYPRIDDGTYLESGAQKALSLGFKNIEIYLSPNVCLTKPRPAVREGIYRNVPSDQKAGWCDDSQYPEGGVNYALKPQFDSLEKLVSSNVHYQRVLQMPFKTVFMTVDPINYKSSAYSIAIGGGVRSAGQQFSSSQLANLYKEFYDLTTYLLRSEAGTHKTFVLLSGNEIDWAMLNGKIDPTLTPQPAAIQNAIAYWNTIHDAITAAKRDNGGSPARVFQACEVNLVAKAVKGGVTATNNVVPATHCDLYGYSAYDTVLPNSRNYGVDFVAAIRYLKKKAPASGAFGSNNVFVSEIGRPEHQFAPGALDPVSGKRNLDQLRDQIKTALQLGLPYVNLWTLYDNECTTFDPTTDDLAGSGCPGYWMIKPSGATSDTYVMLSHAFAAVHRN